MSLSRYTRHLPVPDASNFLLVSLQKYQHPPSSSSLLTPEARTVAGRGVKLTLTASRTVPLGDHRWARAGPPGTSRRGLRRGTGAVPALVPVGAPGGPGGCAAARTPAAPWESGAGGLAAPERSPRHSPGAAPGKRGTYRQKACESVGEPPGPGGDFLRVSPKMHVTWV